MKDKNMTLFSDARVKVFALSTAIVVGLIVFLQLFNI
jgi:hypothetical protein